MGKKIPEEMMKQKEKFFKGCKEFGKVPQEKIEKLWHLIEPFAAYGFNKAHAASYGVVAYQTAYLKANFPIQYMTAILIAESGDIDKVPEIIHECERMGVKVLPPDINESFKNFAMIDAENGRDAHIRFGLNGIKNLGEHIAEVIYRGRKEGGTYKNLEEFLSRVQDKDLNKKSLESLVKCGAMDSFGHDRNVLLANVDNMLAFHRQAHDISASKQHSLFSGTSIDMETKVRLDGAPPALEADKLKWEKELLGLYVTSHPFRDFQKIMEGTLTMIKDLSGHPRSSWVVVGGIIEHTKKKITRGGKAMMFVKIQDTTGGLELLVFPRTYETTKEVWTEGKKVCVIGKTGDAEGDDKLFVEKVYEVTPETVSGILQQLSMGKSMEKAVATPTPPITINQRVDSRIGIEETAEGVELSVAEEGLKNKADKLKILLAQFPGEKTVYLKIGDKKIKTSFKIDKSAAFVEGLRVI
jgi:DNA polymerase-3 subunit alpha